MGLEQISVRGRCKMPATAVQVKLRRGKKAARSTIDNGWTALHCAAACEAPAEVVKVLLQVHPDAAAAKKWNGRLPLHLAGKNENLRQVSKHGDGSAS